MKNKLSSYFNSKYILIAVSVLCLVFIVTSFFSDKLAAPLKNAVSSVVVPLQKGMNYMGLWVSDSVDNMQDINRLIDENEKLNEKINELTVENNQLRQDSYELDRLRELYQLDDKYPGYEKIGARVIGSSSDNWYTTFMVDKGSDDGIEVDMNVIADGGLVGIVTKVGHNYSVIKTVVEDNNFVSAMLIDSGLSLIHI